jgi:hypothetical protein
LQSTLDGLEISFLSHDCIEGRERTSGGMATDHMATPAEPPARMTAGRDMGGAGAGSPLGNVPGDPESFRFKSSYVAKYLDRQHLPNAWGARDLDLHGTSRTVSGQSRKSTSEDGPHTALSIQLPDDVDGALVGRLSGLSLNLRG